MWWYVDGEGRRFTRRHAWSEFYHEVIELFKSDSYRSPSGEVPEGGYYGPYYASLPLSIRDGQPRQRYTSRVTVTVNITGNAPNDHGIFVSPLLTNDQLFWRVEDLSE